MKRISVLLLLLGILSFSITASRSQTREIGGQSLALDDGHGHTVDITVPTMTGPGPYSWTLPITTSGTALSLPQGTTTNSTLYWSGSQWLENTTILTGTGLLAGAITVPNSTITLGLYGGNSTNGVGGSVNVFAGQAGSATTTGGTVMIDGGGGYGTGNAGTSAGGSVQILGGPGNNGNSVGGSVSLQGGNSSGAGTGAVAVVQGGNGGSTGTGGAAQIYGGYAGNTSGAGGNISFWTEPNHSAGFSQAMQVTSGGAVQIGSSNQFQVDNSGNTSTSGTLSTTNAFGLNVRIDNTGNTNVQMQPSDGYVVIAGPGTTSWSLPSSAITGQVLIVNNFLGVTLSGSATINPGNSVMFIYEPGGWQHIILQ